MHSVTYDYLPAQCAGSCLEKLQIYDREVGLLQ